MPDADVAVVGAGPVGMSLGLALARQGRSVIVFEELPDLNEEERASTFHPPTLEMLAEWGVLEEAVTSGRRIDRLQFWERSSRELIAEFSYGLIADDTSCAFRLQCPQSIVTRLMRPKLLEHGGRLALGQRVSSVVDHGDSVSIETGDRTFTARYVVGTDGAGSTVRKSLGIRLSGKTYADRFLLVGADIGLADLFPGMGPVSYVFDPNEWVVLMHLPDRVRLVFRVSDHEQDVMAPESVRARLGGFFEHDRAIGVKSVSVYSVHQRVAERFRDGNVLLAGDAAHVNNPIGGFGMNAGIHDSHALAAALGTALDSGEDVSLRQYAEHRRDVAERRVNSDADANYRRLAARDDHTRATRNRELYEAAADAGKAREWLLRNSMQEDRIAPASAQMSKSIS